MSDITMCMSDDCTRRHECYRHEAKPSEYRQSYSHFYEEGKHCRMFVRYLPDPIDINDIAVLATDK